MRPVSYLLAVSLLAPSSFLQSQAAPTVRPGHRARVTHQCEFGTGESRTNCRVNEGTVATVTADTLVLWIDEQGIELILPVASVARYEVYWKGKSNTKRSALFGLAIGGGFGFIRAFGSCWISGHSCASMGDRLYSGLLNGAFTGVVGAGLGALIGMGSGGRWEEIPLDRLRVSPVVMGDGSFGLAAVVRF